MGSVLRRVSSRTFVGRAEELAAAEAMEAAPLMPRMRSRHARACVWREDRVETATVAHRLGLTAR